ncbi:helicase [Helicobacter pylori]|uniref:helicase n=1 Tax=Helicobacter pylori TaxID=210 RepID=UPI0021C77891|nr:helicase [Helicobacter pylori]
MEKKKRIAQMSRAELEQEFRKKFTAEANLEDSKREWSDRVMKIFHTKTLVYLLSLESREEQEEFIDLATNRQFQKNPIESEIEYMNMYLEEMEYQQERMQEQMAMAHQVQQAEWKMEQEAKKKGIIPQMREEYHSHRNPHLISKIAPEIWGFLSLENSQDRLDAYAFLIMDRWAHYFPQTMKTKDHRTIMILIKAVIEQTKMETEALDRMGAQIKRAQGVSDMELLQEAQINQYYYLLKADYIMQDSSHQMDLETLEKTGIKREDFYQI